MPEAAFASDQADQGSAGAEPNASVHDCPYVGLLPFSVKDAYRFFGRDKERSIIIQNLKASRLTLLYGTSGVGKTSVLRAGVGHTLEFLAKQNMSALGAPKFIVVYFNVWKEDPVLALKKAIEDAVQCFGSSEPLDLSSPDLTLAQALYKANEYVHGTLLLLLDQFEEYFLYHSARVEAFDQQLAQAVNDPGLRANFLISMREDMLAQLDRLKGKIPHILNNYLRLEHLDMDSARSAIENPLQWYNSQAENSGGTFKIEAELIDTVLHQVITGQVVLGDAGRGVVLTDSAHSEDFRIEAPLLQLVMTRLWEEERRKGSTTLRLATLVQLGGAAEIADRYLDEALEALSGEQQQIAASIFYYLVTPSGLKIVQTVGDLAEMAHVSREHLMPVLEHLSTDSRVLRSVDSLPGSGGDLRYQIFHDVLAPAVLAWRAKYVKAQELREAQNRAAEQQLRAERESRVAWRLRWLSAGLIVFLVVSAIAIYYASKNRILAHREAQRSYARELEASAVSNLRQDPQLSVLLALRSLSVLSAMHEDTPLPAHLRDAISQSVQASRQIFVRHHGNLGAKIQDVAFSPDGTSFITVADDGSAKIWDASTGNCLVTLAGDKGNLYKTAFSPNGEYLATLNTDGIVTLYKRSGDLLASMPKGKAVVLDFAFVPGVGKIVAMVYDPQFPQEETLRLQVWSIENGAVNVTLNSKVPSLFLKFSVVAISNDAKRIAFAGSDEMGVIVDLATTKAVSLVGHKGSIESLVFSPDGERLATGSNDGTAKIWDVRTGTLVRDLKGHTNTVFRVAFDPADPSRVATASADGMARIWDSDTGKSLVILTGHKSAVNSIAFSPDGKRVVTASWDGSVILWDPTSMHSGPVTDVAFGGNQLATGGQDGTIRLWDASSFPLRNVKKMTERADEVTSLVFSPDGKRFAASGSNGWARVFDSSGSVLAALPGLESTVDVNSIAFSPTRQLIVTAHNDGTFRIWDSESAKLISTTKGHPGPISSAAFSPDGNHLATAGQDQTIRLWDDSGKPWPGSEAAQFTRKLQDQVMNLAFSPDGRMLAAATLGGAVVVFDLKSGKDFALIGHRMAVSEVKFDRRGQKIVTASWDRTVRIWDVASHTMTAMFTHPTGVEAVAFRADGKYLVTGANDGMVRMYPLDDNELLSLARSRVTRSITEEECRQFLHPSECASLK
jgi:WD40 repeat protein